MLKKMEESITTVLLHYCETHAYILKIQQEEHSHGKHVRAAIRLVDCPPVQGDQSTISTGIYISRRYPRRVL